MRRQLSLFTVFFIVGTDQITKFLATDYLKERLGGYAYFNGFFRFIYAENEGAFLSLGSEITGWLKYITLYAFPVLLLVGLLWYILKSSSLSRSQIIALSLVLGGGLSNIYDRLLYGKVVDFMIMGIGDLKTGVFNIADVSIMTGLFLLILNRKKKEPAAKKKNEIPVETENIQSTE